MPSFDHQLRVLLFRSCPRLAPELLRDALGMRLPQYVEVCTDSGELSEMHPAERHADLVVLLKNDQAKPVLGIVVEVQLSADARKRRSWPAYVANLGSRLECDCVVLVVAPCEAVARWAAVPIHLGGGSFVQPLVLGPSAVPHGARTG